MCGGGCLLTRLDRYRAYMRSQISRPPPSHSKTLRCVHVRAHTDACIYRPMLASYVRAGFRRARTELRTTMCAYAGEHLCKHAHLYRIRM